MFSVNDRIGMIACSDGLGHEKKEHVERLIIRLKELGLHPVVAKTLYRQGDTPFSGTPKERAQALMELFMDDRIQGIFDVSGGESANQILPHLDYNVIRKHPKPFFGLSDLTVLLNGIYAMTGIPTYHFQLMTLLQSESQIDYFRRNFISESKTHSFNSNLNLKFLRGKKLDGIVIGGNIRCFLKLSGTPYMPDPRNKVILLESLGGGPSRQASLLAQLDQSDILARCSGVLIGRFSEMEREKYSPTIEALVLAITEKYQLPVAKTDSIGHGPDGQCIPIGLPLNQQA